MKSIIFFLALLIFISCEENLHQPENFDLKLKNSVIALDSYYHSEEVKTATYSQMVAKVRSISADFDISITPLSLKEFNENFPPLNSSLRTMSCGAGPIQEIVDEGGGCYGFVRVYSDYSSSIERYCYVNGSITYQGRVCYV